MAQGNIQQENSYDRTNWQAKFAAGSLLLYQHILR